jgi:hypothetical protein
MASVVKSPRFDERRVARIAAIVLAIVAFVYEAAANLGLSTRAIAKLISQKPDRLRLEYGTARSFWPGRVHVENLDIRSRASTIEWELHIDKADADISLLSLLRHRFHVSKVTATGVTFRLRFRLDPNALNADRAARMPPIDGFDVVPIAGVPPDPPPGTGTPWIVDLQGVDAKEVREVWIDAFRLSGLLEARGGFTVGADHFKLAPATAAIQTVALTTGDDVIVDHVTGSLAAKLDPVDLSAVQGLAVLRYLSMQSALEGKTESLRFLRHFVRTESVAFSGGAGTFRGETNVVRGLVSAGTSSHMDLEPASVVVFGRPIVGQASLDLTTGDADDTHEQPWIALETRVSDLSLTEPKANEPAVTSKLLTAHASADAIDLADPGRSAESFAYSWSSPRVDVLDLHAVEATIPPHSGFHIEHGTATISASGRGSVSGLRAEVELDSKVTMRVMGARLTSGVKGSVPFEASFVGHTLDMSGADLSLSDPARAGWWSRVKVGTAKVHLAPASVTLGLTMTARDGAPFLAFYTETRKSSTVADATIDVLPKALSEAVTANLHGELHLRASKGAFDLTGVDVKGASSRFRADLRKRATRLDGGMLIEAGPTSLGISFAGGKTGLVVFDAPKWFETNVAPAAR